MRKRILSFLLLISMLCCLCGCSDSTDNSTFSIQFIDVGQGDSALVECDGHYMLIDGGDKNAGDTIYNVLEEKGIQTLDILAISHLHEDHIGGLAKALTYAQNIKLTISNADERKNNDVFKEFENRLTQIGGEITIPHVGDKWDLGSATVEVIDVSAEESNDSLVLLITYGDTRFLFTGDIQRNGQLRVAEVLRSKYTNFDGVSLIKMPHHGAYNDNYGFTESALNTLFWEFDPSYFIISVGANNSYNHPHQETIEIIEQVIVRAKEMDWDEHVFRTDENGNITVFSNGKELFVEVRKE